MTLLVGERANGPEALDRTSTEAAVRLRHGAFRWGPARKRLSSLGLVWDAAANLLPRMPTRTATWDRRAREQAREAATNLIVWAAGQRDPVVVLAGRRVCDSFGLTYEPLCWQSVDVDDVRVPVLAIPHPSGMCRWWNDPENLTKAKACLTNLRSCGR